MHLLPNMPRKIRDADEGKHAWLVIHAAVISRVLEFGNEWGLRRGDGPVKHTFHSW